MANSKLATFGKPADSQYVHLAPYTASLTLPTSATDTLDSSVWQDAGLVTEDGVTQGMDLGKEDPLRDWNLKPILSAEGTPSATLEIRMMSQMASTLGIVFGSNNVTGSDAQGVSYTFDGTTDTFAIVIDMLWNDINGKPNRAARLVYPMCTLKELADIDYTKQGAVIYDCTFEVLTDDNGDFFHAYLAGSGGSTQAAPANPPADGAEG